MELDGKISQPLNRISSSINAIHLLTHVSLRSNLAQGSQAKRLTFTKYNAIVQIYEH